MSLGRRKSVEFNNFDELYEELKKYGVEDKDNETGSRKELRKLYDLASEVKEGCILEIGTFKGYSTTVFAVAAPTLIIHAVDPYENYPKEVRCKKDIIKMKQAREHAEKMWGKLGLENIKLHNKSSREIQPQEIDKALKIGLLFIDGDHVRDEEYVPVALKDYEKFEKSVLDGYIIFHDFNPEDPQADDEDAVNEAVKTIIERTKKKPEVFEQLAIFPNSRSLWRQFLDRFALVKRF